MLKLITSLLLLFMVRPVASQLYLQKEPFAHTYSIVARDPDTGEMAVGVQSHWFSVGTAVSWGEAGVGVIATQSFVNKSCSASFHLEIIAGSGCLINEKYLTGLLSNFPLKIGSFK